MCVLMVLFFFFNQNTAYEVRISDWSSVVCSSDLRRAAPVDLGYADGQEDRRTAGRSGRDPRAGEPRRQTRRDEQYRERHDQPVRRRKARDAEDEHSVGERTGAVEGRKEAGRGHIGGRRNLEEKKYIIMIRS